MALRSSMASTCHSIFNSEILPDIVIGNGLERLVEPFADHIEILEFLEFFFNGLTEDLALVQSVIHRQPGPAGFDIVVDADAEGCHGLSSYVSYMSSMEGMQGTNSTYRSVQAAACWP